MKSEKFIVFRVECNNGSKYFYKGTDAYTYYEKMKEQRMTSVELWLVSVDDSPKNYYARQELLAFSKG